MMCKCNENLGIVSAMAPFLCIFAAKFKNCMATKRLIADKDFGQIIVRTHAKARNITMRVKADGLHVTVPPLCRTAKITEVVEEYRVRLLEQWERMKPQPLDLNFRIEAPCFRLRVEQGQWKCFTVKITEEETVIFCPPDVDFTANAVQKLLRNAIIRAMKRKAGEYLPVLLKEWAERYNLTYKRVKITASRSRWGSCSAVKNINLSCYLMLLPPHLMDYVILHELAHTKEMNHGPRFWELLDNMTEGQALRLRKELRAHTFLY